MMKQIQKILVLVFTIGTFAVAHAQTTNTTSPTTTQSATPKFGHLNSDELIALMPQTQTARQQLQAFQASLQNDLKLMETEFQTMYTDFLQKSKSNSFASETQKNTQQKNLEDMQNRIVDFQENAQQELGKKEVELLQPVLEKAQKAIDEVAAENGFTYILDTSKGAVLFAQESLDILPLVKAKLGIQ